MDADYDRFLSFTQDGLEVRLVKGKRSRVTFVYRQDAERTAPTVGILF